MRESLRLGSVTSQKSTPGSCAEVQGSFFLTAIHFFASRREFGGSYGDERGAVAQEMVIKA